MGNCQQLFLFKYPLEPNSGTKISHLEYIRKRDFITMFSSIELMNIHELKRPLTGLYCTVFHNFWAVKFVRICRDSSFNSDHDRLSIDIAGWRTRPAIWPSISLVDLRLVGLMRTKSYAGNSIFHYFRSYVLSKEALLRRSLNCLNCFTKRV